MQPITILNYKSGNLRAITNVFDQIGCRYVIAENPKQLNEPCKIVLPGVGAFDQAMLQLESSGMVEALSDLVIRKRVPILGICVGMQILGTSSDEGLRSGLGWIPGKVKKIENQAGCLRLPHMGWNDVTPNHDEPLFSGMSAPRFYFLHSYYFDCNDRRNVSATVEYGSTFPCAVRSANIFGVQFHPEKSHQFGAQLLKNFAELKC